MVLSRKNNTLTDSEIVKKARKKRRQVLRIKEKGVFLQSQKTRGKASRGDALRGSSLK
jgi:hypothetical protein